jgi:hypothetical protein
MGKRIREKNERQNKQTPGVAEQSKTGSLQSTCRLPGFLFPLMIFCILSC